MSFHVYIAKSLDGYVATPNGDVQWLEPFNGCDYGYEKFIASIDTIVIGRVTYEQSLTFGEWPYKGNRVIVQSSRITFLRTPSYGKARQQSWSPICESGRRVKTSG